MMKITLFVFAVVLLFAVAFALPKPDEPVAETTGNKDFNLEQLAKMVTEALGKAQKEITEFATQENIDKFKTDIEATLGKMKETADNAISSITEKKSA